MERKKEKLPGEETIIYTVNHDKKNHPDKYDATAQVT